MASLILGRKAPVFDAPFVLFLIGARINAVHRPDKWLPVVRAMVPMLTELAQRPEAGCLHTEYLRQSWRAPVMLQYWRDFDALEAYATRRDGLHFPAWSNFNRHVADNPAVGIFHETYCIDARRYEGIAWNMPPFGLQAVAGSVDATEGRASARSRMRGE